MRVILRRLQFFVVTLWAAVTLNFALPRLMPGSPMTAVMARYRGRLSPATIKAFEIAFNIHPKESLPSQYLDYLDNMAHLQFGLSIGYFPEPVINVVMQALPWTLALAGITTIIGFILGTFVGMLVAWRRGGLLDTMLTPAFIVLNTVPYFWVGLIAIYVFAVTGNWLPSSDGYDVTTTNIGLSWSFVWQAFVHSLLPGGTIIITAIGAWILTMRNNMIGTLSEDYVRMARAKGLSPARIMIQYAGRNAILPNLAGFAMSLGFVVSGLLLVEIVFNYPGLGNLLLQAVENQDYPLMQALFLMITLAVLFAILLADIANALLDPRTRSGD
ncbi:MAG TPA: ABC transporter permease [Chloroflexota bacterium]|nr:ABC transporter permease [Chloroflexota bacterium]